MATTVPLKSFELQGYKENFADYISHLSGEKTPFLDCVGKDTAKNYQVQWVYDKNPTTWVVSPSLEGREFTDNDGDDEKFILPVQGSVYNFAQKFTRRVAVSFSAAALDVYGRENEVKYQLDKAGVDLKRQLELVLLSSQERVEGTATVARKTSGLLDILTKSSPGAQNVHFYTKTAGLKWADLEAVFKGLHDADSEASLIFCNDALVKELVAFKDTDAKPALQVFKDIKITKPNGETITGQKEHLTITDQFGKVWVIVPSRYMETGSLYFIDPELIDVVYFREPAVLEIDPVGSYERYLVECEATVRVKDASKIGALFPKA